MKVDLSVVEDAKDQKKIDAARKAEQRKRHCAPQEDDGKQDGTQPATGKQTTLQTWLAAKVQELDVAFARFMYHAGLPFAVADDPELQTFIDTLVMAVRNGVTSYTVPTRQRVAGPLLDIFCTWSFYGDSAGHCTCQCCGICGPYSQTWLLHNHVC